MLCTTEESSVGDELLGSAWKCHVRGWRISSGSRDKPPCSSRMYWEMNLIDFSRFAPFQVRTEAHRVALPYPCFEASGGGMEKPLHTFSL